MRRMQKDHVERRRRFADLKAKVVAAREEKRRMIDAGLAVEEPEVDIFAVLELDERHRLDEELVFAAVGGPEAFRIELAAICSGGFRPFDPGAVGREHLLASCEDLPLSTHDQLDAATHGETTIADFFDTTSRAKP